MLRYLVFGWKSKISARCYPELSERSLEFILLATKSLVASLLGIVSDVCRPRNFLLTGALACAVLGCGSPDLPTYFYSGGTRHAFIYENDGIRFESGAPAHLTRRIVVGISDKRGHEEIASQVGLIAQSVSHFSPRVVLADFASIEDALNAANNLYKQPGIRWSHPDFSLNVEARETHDPVMEPYIDKAWHLKKINAPQAWQVTQGNQQTLVALIDLGFEQNHSDLKPSWYQNKAEIPDNRLDDDGNGYIDDFSGWNFALNGNNLIYGMNAAHGTATAGVIGARADGHGTVGICPNCSILPLVIDDSPVNAAAAFYYAYQAGAIVISNSWGYGIGTPQTDVLVEAIEDIAMNGRDGKGATIVFAMDNRNRDNCRGLEPDISSLEAVIAVSASDRNDRKIRESGYGECLDLVAPSAASARNAIVTSDRPGPKGYNRGDNRADFQDLDYTNSFYGTSAAAPQVAAAFALLYSASPALTHLEAKRIIIDSADKISPETANYNPKTGLSSLYGYGRLNIGRALQPQDNQL